MQSGCERGDGSDGASVAVDASSEFVAWTDGASPWLAIAGSRERALGALAEGLERESNRHGKRGPVRLTVVVGSDGVLPPFARVLREVSRKGPTEVAIQIRGRDRLMSWRGVYTWVERCSRYLSRTQSSLGGGILIETTVADTPEGFREFLAEHVKWCGVIVTDKGEDRAECRRRLEVVEAIADCGIRVEVRTELARGLREEWLRMARDWRAATRGGRLSFVAAVGGEAPSSEELAEFLTALYESGEFDLWQTDPFATILQALSGGLESIPRCGTPSVAAAIGDAFVVGCENGSRECARAVRKACGCRFSALCDVVGPTCLATTTTGSDGVESGAGRPFCRAVQELVPRFLEELAKGAKYQHAIRARPAPERFHAAAQKGAVRVWSHGVRTEHGHGAEGV